ncbi:lactonase family protein [Jatrophihabitans lederbergiae]|uniref:Lactonase family protein n=1 Tax=Jatrophihabitans lederbergiae TaxID=3075547 RepID=A0ABU2JG43_9ACTN|nr:hypothetical protein [Jatrophihabitans sp. DSM 44399]MDT0263965.1 hypothetical protein [Jatrophihabitans sp. DSM 44399]
MRALPSIIGFAGLSAAACLSFAGPASASPSHADGAVFVQTQNSAGNRIVAYDRNADGGLTPAGSTATGGNGATLTGAVVDKTASQGALVADRRHRELYAVNAGSNTVSVLRVHGDDLKLRQVIDSGGAFPVSVTVHDDIVYVLNARDGGSIQGYLNIGGKLHKVDAWHRTLGLDASATPEFIVTTKANTNAILSFGVGRFGDLSATPTVRTEPGAVPFAISYDTSGHLVVADAGINAVSTYSIGADSTLTPLSVTPTGQAATCWVTSSGDLLIASNAGSGTVTALKASNDGHTTILADTAVDKGTVDAAFSPNGQALYVQGGATGTVSAFAVSPNGGLTATGVVTVPGAVAGEGIVVY